VSQQEHRRSSQRSNSLSSSNGQLRADEPDPEVVVPRRRRFSAAYKQRILAEAEACTERGELGALLRREGLYSSHLTRWRGQRRAGADHRRDQSHS
jgi:transposase